MLTNMLIWLSAKTPVEVRASPHVIPELAQVREQIVTTRLRAATIFGSLALVVTTILGLQQSIGLFAGYTTVVILCWMFAFNRQIDYRLRGSVLVVATYFLALNELFHYGYSATTILYFGGFALLPLSFLSRQVSVSALILAVVTLALVGVLISNNILLPFHAQALKLTIANVVSLCLIFMIIIGAIQSGNFALRRSLEIGWTREYDARLQLKQSHDRLEQRVAERTAELVELNQAILVANQAIAAQSQYLGLLQQTTFDLLHHHTLPTLFQDIIDRATTILMAPYAELRMYDGQGFPVQASAIQNLHISNSHTSHVAGHVFESRQPVVIDDYIDWAVHHSNEHPLNLQTVVGFPMMAGNLFLGVLILGRSALEQPFTAEQIQQGQLFTHMIGLVIERVGLYDRALNEIAVRTQAEQALRLQTEQLRLQNAELDAFAHTVAHDLATPLTGIVGYSELLKMLLQRGKLEDLPETCDVIIRTGQKMSQIINEILLLASIRKQSDIPKHILTMEHIIHEVEARLAHKIGDRQATIIRPATWPVAFGHAPWVEEVWTNYLDNALKYGGQPPHIELNADQDLPGFVRFWVCDNGQGLSTEQQAQVFTTKTRFHTAQADGHGLGLSIVARIISKLGGEVGVESIPGHGARFFFTLPSAEQEVS